MRVEGSRLAKRRLRKLGAPLYVWLDEDGLAHGRATPPPEKEFVREDFDGHTIYVATDMVRPAVLHVAARLVPPTGFVITSSFRDGGADWGEQGAE
jgi:hypothetical protein